MFHSWWLGNSPTGENEASVGTFPRYFGSRDIAIGAVHPSKRAGRADRSGQRRPGDRPVIHQIYK
jgi:hypothetical protein